METESPNLDWYDVTAWGIEGRAWTDEPRARWFDRLPASAENEVREAVWDLSRQSAGMMARFETDATEIWVDYQLYSESIAMPHMPATGVSGIDLYTRDSAGRWRWVMVVKPEARDVRTRVIEGLAPGNREYAAFLPLYNGVNFLKFGVPAKRHFRGLAPRSDQPIVFYGTSITQGGCASRPGMAHTAILGRRFDRPVVNLGFSGNGEMEPEIGALLTRIDAAVYVIDCNPNLQAEQIAARCIPLVTQLRETRPETPIVLVEDRRTTHAWILPQRTDHHDRCHEALKRSCASLREQGFDHLFYIPGDDLLGHDSEGTTDGSHPNDLGFLRQADAFEPILRQALGLDRE